MRNLVRAVLLVVLAGAASDARAFVRSTTTPGHPETGVCQWWGTRQVVYKVNATGSARAIQSPPCGDASRAIDEVKNALRIWGQSCTDLRFIDGGTTPTTTLGDDGTNLIVFRAGPCNTVAPGNDACRGTPGACATKYNCWEHDLAIDTIDTLALTTTTFDTRTGEILDADVELHLWTPNDPSFGAHYTCAGPGMPTCPANDPGTGTSCNHTDVANVMLHEVGHMLGLDHTCQYAAPHDSCPAGGSSMAPTTARGDVRRVLEQDDVDGLCRIYPGGQPTLKCVADAPASEKKAGGGCASGGEAGLVALAGAVAALRRASRRRASA